MRRNIPLSPGYRVGVPFGKNKLYTGLVYKKHQVAPQTYTPKAIEVILDEYPLVHAQQLAFWEWMSDYYRCTMGNILRTALPSAFLLTSETTVTKQEDAEVHWDELSDEAFLVMEALEKSDLLVEDIQAIVQRKRILPLIHGLVEMGYVQTVQSLKEKYTQNTTAISVFIQIINQKLNCISCSINLNVLQNKVNCSWPCFSCKKKIKNG